MTDDAQLIRLKVRKAKTDPDLLPGTAEGLDGRPEAENLLGIYAALTDTSLEDTCRAVAGWPFSRFKEALADLAAERLGPIGAEMQRLEADPAYLDGILARGAERADAIARPILREIYGAVGFLDAGLHAGLDTALDAGGDAERG